MRPITVDEYGGRMMRELHAPPTENGTRARKTGPLPKRAPTNGNGHHSNGVGENGGGGAGTIVFDEQTLAEASVSGSTEAFEELYRFYFPKVRGFCLRKIGKPDVAEDIAQEAFARAFARIDSFGGPKHFGGWVATIAANLCTDHFRRKRNTEVPLDDSGERGPSYEIDPLRNIQRETTTQLIRLALERLEPRQREALLLHEVRGMTCAAVGDRLGISAVAAESLLARARRRLRKEVTSELDGKAAPGDLLGVGGVVLVPGVLRAARRLRERIASRAADVGAFAGRAAGRGWDGVVAALPVSDGLKAAAVAAGAAVTIGTASVTAPSGDSPTPQESRPPTSAAETQSTSAFLPGLLGPPGGTDPIGVIDPLRELLRNEEGASPPGDGLELSTEETVGVPAPSEESEDGHVGWEVDAGEDESGEPSVDARVRLGDGDGGAKQVDLDEVTDLLVSE